jgi:hypothetical protein
MPNGDGVDKVGDKRVFVLVEDPVTGENKWMLEAKAEENHCVEDNGRFVAGMDVWCGFVFLLTMFFPVFFGSCSLTTLVPFLTMMIVQM